MTIKWTSETRKLSELQPYEFNPRTITKGDLEKLKQSIVESGYNAPILIDADNTIIAGHARWHALKLMKHEEADVRVPDRKLSEHEFKAINIRDNVNNGEWDVDMLANHFDTTDLLNWGIPESLFEGFTKADNAGLTPDDDVPEIVEGDPTAKLGDLYILGNHRLLCGDSTNPDHVKRLLDGQAPNTMITDPPYGVKLDMSWRDKAKNDGAKNNKNVVMNDDKADWYETYVLFPGNVAYVWHASAFTDVVMKNLRDAGFDVKQQIIWNKPSLVLGRSHYHWKHEPCWYAVKTGNNANWKGDRKQTTVWDCAPPNKSCSSSKDDKTEHPTQKPLELYTRALEHHTSPGEYAYDPFGGSGTLIIACEKLQRRALSMELDPKYVDVIVKRWEQFTGLKAELKREINDA